MVNKSVTWDRDRATEHPLFVVFRVVSALHLSHPGWRIDFLDRSASPCIPFGMSKVTHLTTDEHGGPNRRRLHLREISGDAEAPLGNVGQELRAARLRRGDDLAAVSRVLKIRKFHLDALEEDKFEKLPGRAYAVGFVRAYAEYLGLDAVAAVERFKEETAGRSDGTYQITLVPDADERRLPHGWLIIVGVLVAIIGYAGYHLAISADALLRQPVAPVPARIAPRPPVATFTRPVLPHSTPAAASHNPATTAPSTASAGAAGASSQVAASRPAFSAAATSGSGASTAGLPTTGTAATPGTAASATPNAQLAGLPKGQEYGSQNKNARVILHAKALTRVLVQGPDGTVFINRVLHPGDSYRVPDKVGLTLTTPNGAAVALELDGQEVGVAGKDGQVTEALPLDPQAITDRYNGGAPRQGG